MAGTSENHEFVTTIETEIESALQQLAAGSEGKTAGLIREIIYTNLERGRVATFLGRNNNVSPGDYVLHVADCHQRLNVYIRQVQIDKDEEVWGDLFETFQRWSYNYLLKRNFIPGEETFRKATGFAIETALELMNAHFPYDVEFEPWAYVLLQNVCRRQIVKAMRRKDIPDDKIVPLDAILEWIPDVSKIDEKYYLNLKQKLLEGIEQLSSVSRKQVIKFYYFDRHSFPEIAARMGKRVNAVYKLHFDALQNLRKVLKESGDFD